MAVNNGHCGAQSHCDSRFKIHFYRISIKRHSSFKLENFQMFPNGSYMDAVSKTVFLKRFAAMEKLLLWQQMLLCFILLIDLP